MMTTTLTQRLAYREAEVARCRQLVARLIDFLLDVVGIPIGHSSSPSCYLARALPNYPSSGRTDAVHR